MKNDPTELLARYKPIIDDWDAFVEHLGSPLPQCLWANPNRISSADFKKILEDEGLHPETFAWLGNAFRIDACPGLGKKWWYRAGLCHSQEEVSLLPVHLMGVEKGERILDLCAAPGGKTAQLAFAVGNTGTVVANDAYLTRLNMVRTNLKRLGILNVCTTRSDGANYPRKAGLFDRVLVDVPCSCEGTVRRKDVREIGEVYSKKYAQKQKLLIESAIRLCRPGGIIVYSTCTFAPEENELIVDEQLRLNPSLVIKEIALPQMKVAEGITQWQGQELLPELKKSVRLYPHHNNTGGFYIALLQKGDEPTKRFFPCGEITPIEHPVFFEEIRERYGLPDDCLQGSIFHEQTRQGSYLASAYLTPPIAPEPTGSGMIFTKMMKYPKLSTAGAMVIGHLATRSIVELNEEQRDLYHQRMNFLVEREQLIDVRDSGFIIVRYKGIPLGTGRVNPETLEFVSLFPKRWVLE
jgi:NOL1/NOP2/sun family putative RNA methylase